MRKDESGLRKSPRYWKRKEGSFQLAEVDRDVQSGFYRTSIKIMHSGDYGLVLNGSLDKTEEQVHFDRYEIYVSPLTVYLMMERTYQGEVDAIWGMCRNNVITIGFMNHILENVKCVKK